MSYATEYRYNNILFGDIFNVCTQNHVLKHDVIETAAAAYFYYFIDISMACSIATKRSQRRCRLTEIWAMTLPHLLLSTASSFCGYYRAAANCVFSTSGSYKILRIPNPPKTSTLNSPVSRHRVVCRRAPNCHVTVTDDVSRWFFAAALLVHPVSDIRRGLFAGIDIGSYIRIAGTKHYSACFPACTQLRATTRTHDSPRHGFTKHNLFDVYHLHHQLHPAFFLVVEHPPEQRLSLVVHAERTGAHKNQLNAGAMIDRNVWRFAFLDGIAVNPISQT